jgi:DNA-binding NarL/FixJ family response regulator
MIRVLIVDDQDLVRDGIRAVLEAAPDIVVVGEA